LKVIKPVEAAGVPYEPPASGLTQGALIQDLELAQALVKPTVMLLILPIIMGLKHHMDLEINQALSGVIRYPRLFTIALTLTLVQPLIPFLERPIAQIITTVLILRLILFLFGHQTKMVARLAFVIAQLFCFIVIDYNSSRFWILLGVLHWSMPEYKLDLQYWKMFYHGLSRHGIQDFQLLVPNSNQGFCHWLQYTLPKLQFWFWLIPCFMAWFEFLGMLSVSAVIGIDRTVQTGILHWSEFETKLKLLITALLVIELLIMLVQARLARREFSYSLIHISRIGIWFGLWYWFGYTYWTDFIYGFMLGPLFVMLI